MGFVDKKPFLLGKARRSLVSSRFQTNWHDKWIQEDRNVFGMAIRSGNDKKSMSNISLLLPPFCEDWVYDYEWSAGTLSEMLTMVPSSQMTLNRTESKHQSRRTKSKESYWQTVNGTPFSFRMLVKYSVPAPICSQQQRSRWKSERTLGALHSKADVNVTLQLADLLTWRWAIHKRITSRTYMSLHVWIAIEVPFWLCSNSVSQFLFQLWICPNCANDTSKYWTGQFFLVRRESHEDTPSSNTRDNSTEKHGPFWLKEPIIKSHKEI